MRLKTGISKIYRPIRLAIGFSLLFILPICNGNSHAQNIPIPQLDSISIDGSNPILSWFPNTDNTLGYIVIRHDWNGSTYIWRIIDTVFGINQTNYTDNNVNACEASQWYRMIAFGAGVNNNSLWSDTVKTIFQEPPILDICENSVFLQWSEYVNMTPELAGYQILASKSGSPYFEVASTGPGRLYYKFRNLVQNTLYSFKIRAFNSGKTRTSTTCERTLQSYTPKQPEHIFIRYATVENNEHIKLEWIADTTAPISKFKILRSDNGFNFDTISEISDLKTYNPSRVYIDQLADFNTQSYFYQIRACDSCGVDTLASANIAKTIYLSGYPSPTGTTNQLEWNAYEGWDRTEVQEYNIYRKVDDVQNPSGSLATVDGLTTSYIDDVSGLSNLEGSFSYFIEAIENDGFNGSEDFKDQSRSNEITIELDPKVIIPNAFGPNLPPPDNEFKPLIAFIDTESYQLSIFNKWGQMLFETSDPNKGWDGRYNGEYLPTDAYVYLIVYHTPEGQTIEKMGTITVLR